MAEKVGINPMTLHRIETGMVRLSLRRPNLSSPLQAWRSTNSVHIVHLVCLVYLVRENQRNQINQTDG
jgi:hypothetical protein